MQNVISAYSGRLNYLAQLRDARRYLEIGVNAGDTFFQVPVPFKAAVDPMFLFDPNERGRAGEFFFSTTSDSFFEELSKPDSLTVKTLAEHFGGDTIQFDLIFIDGLHTFEQTLKDFENSIKFSHENTVWLIDDVVPCDKYSAVPDQKVSLKLREKALLSGAPWHGDVFKVIPAIHDNFPSYSYCTLIEGNPQAIVWKSKNRNISHEFQSIESISEMSSGDIESHVKVFMLSTTEEALQLIGTTLEPKAVEQPQAVARLHTIYHHDGRHDAEGGHSKRAFPKCLRFLPRWRNSLMKRLPMLRGC